MISKLLLLVTISFLQALKIGNFLHINSIIRQNNRLVVSTPGGVFTYDLFENKLDRSVITETPVKLALMQNLLTVFYIDMYGNLYRWTTSSGRVFYLASVGQATSLGVCCDKIYVENNGTITAFSTSGFRLGRQRPENGTVWVGRLNSYSKDSLKVSFLAPFFFYDDLAGKVELTYFYRDFNTLWVGTDRKGIYMYDMNLKTVRDSIQIGLAFDKVESIIGVDEKIFFGGDRGIVVKRKETWTPIEAKCQGVKKIAILNDTIYYENNCGIYLLTPNWQKLFQARAKLLGIHKGLIVIQKGDYLLELSPGANILYRVKTPYEISGMWIYKDQPIFLINKRVYSLDMKPLRKFNKFFPIYSMTSQGDTIYLLTEMGILKFSDGIVEKFPVPLRPASGISYPMVAGKNRLFIGSPEGVYIVYLEDLPFQRYTPDLRNPRVESLYFDGERLYIGTRRGLIILSF